MSFFAEIYGLAYAPTVSVYYNFYFWVFIPQHGSSRPTGIDKNWPIRGAEFSTCTQEFEAFNIGQVLQYFDIYAYSLESSRSI